MLKVTITIEETEEAAGVVHNNAEVIEINYELNEHGEMPVVLDNWIAEHVGSRPRDRG